MKFRKKEMGDMTTTAIANYKAYSNPCFDVQIPDKTEEMKKMVKDFSELFNVLKSEEYKAIRKEYLVLNHDIRNGKRVIKGTRITLADVFALVDEGLSLDEILKEMPSLADAKLFVNLEILNRKFGRNLKLKFSVFLLRKIL